MAEALLETCGLDARHGDFQALFGVSLALSQGEVVAVIGANGAGKTTLMRSICGLLVNEPGMVRYQGGPVGDLRPDELARRGIAMVPEGRQLFASLSVEENLVIGGQVGRAGDWSLEAVYSLFPVLEDRRHAPSTALSGGQQQMVAIGRALMANPDLILFDELSLGLAPIVINDIYAILPRVIASGVTALIVEQDISRALAVSSRYYCLQEGRITLAGDSAQASQARISQAYFGV